MSRALIGSADFFQSSKIMTVSANFSLLNTAYEVSTSDNHNPMILAIFLAIIRDLARHVHKRLRTFH